MDLSGSISIFSISATTGVPTPAGSASVPSPSGVATDPAGKFLFVSAYSNSQVSAYAVDAASGALVLVGSYAAGTGPVGLGVDPSGQYLYVANSLSNDISGYSIASNGALTSLGSSPAGVNPRSVSFASVGGSTFVYAPNADSAGISEYNLGAGGTLVPVTGSPLATGNRPLSLAVDPAGRFVYLADGTQVQVFSVAQSGPSMGSLSSVGSYPAGAGPTGIAVDSSGAFLYVSNTNGLNVSGFSVGASGTLAGVPGTPFPAGVAPAFLAISPAKLLAATSTAVTSSAGTSLVYGQPTTLTATITAPTAATGTIDFFDGAAKINASPIAVSGNQAQITYLPSSLGSHSITTTYSGDSDFQGSTSPAVLLGVNKASTSISNPVAAGTPAFGQTVTFTTMVSAVAPGSGTPTGTVTFKDGSTTLGAVSLSNGSASLSTSALGVGSHAITVTYSGDANFLASGPGTLTFVENKANTVTTVTAAPNTAFTVLTATVVGSPAVSATPTGSVQFLANGAVIATATLTGGTATAATTQATGTITAVYLGDANFNGSTSTAISAPAPIRKTASLSLGASPNPAALGQAVTLTATLTYTGKDVPTGSVRFLEGATVLGSATLRNLQASVTVALGAGPHVVVAMYSGDAAYPQASADSSITIKRVPDSLSLTLAAPAAVFGQSVMMTAALTGQAPNGVGAPTGQIQFYDGITLLGSAPLANGKASFPVSGLFVGTHPITARYDGDGNWAATSSTVSPLTVARAGTVTGISTSPAGANQLALTAAVAALLPGAGTPTGTVQFLDSATGRVLSSATLSSGTASATVPAGNGPIIAAFGGNANFIASTSVPDRFSLFNAASYTIAPVAPNEIVSVFGAGLAGANLSAQPPLPDTLGGVTVTLTDITGASRKASLFYVSPGQINFLVPADTKPGPATLNIATEAGAQFTAVVNVAQSSPALFAAGADGKGPAAAQIIRAHADGSQETLPNTSAYDSVGNVWKPVPIDLSRPGDTVYLVLYGTGIRNHIAEVTCTINGRAIPAQYAGAQPTYAGLDQVNVLLPATLKGAGTVNVTITVDGIASNTVTVAIL